MIKTDQLPPDLIPALIENAFDGIYIIDLGGRVTFWNKGAERITGFRHEQVFGSSCRDNPIKHIGENGQELLDGDLPLLSTLQDRESRETHVFIKHFEGFRVSVLIRTIPIIDNKGDLSGVVELINDNKTIIAAYQRTHQVEQTILLDDLTGIGRRSHIENKIKIALEDYKLNGTAFGILLIDIDHFKRFNDRYGHLTGDKVLRFVANTLKNHLRVTDSCGRWGGDEFLALIQGIKSHSLLLVAEKLRQLVEGSGIGENGRAMIVTISIGAGMVCEGDTLQSLFQRADEMLYRSKHNGRNRVSMSD